MQPISLIPAAQYVRMSTEDQQYSIANQGAAIADYARRCGLEVVSTYADPGKSGISIKSRDGLRQLLADVIGGKARFQAILVYDISRWGRFQDIDESAHYEFLCRSAGIPVHYCAEQFSNDGSIASSIMKTLKRTMAAEYSRELGTKVLAGQQRIARLGFRAVGTAGFGLRRMMISPDGRRRIVLQDGERKAVHTDRTILVPGPRKEVECVRTMFELASSGKSTKEIARELNRRRMAAPTGGLWGRDRIHRILTNSAYAGWNTYGKTTQKLGQISRVVTCRTCIPVGDVLIREDTWTFSVGPREISFGPVTAALFRTLLMNADCIVSKEKLLSAVPDDFDSSGLSKHIYVLRNKLGRENEWRIRTVRHEGYMYVTQDHGYVRPYAAAGHS
jgi:DNA invertase Pin-like site-specific DNA recombinase/DNA-binding winged helix-turn-helix (wHTH) protein